MPIAHLLQQYQPRYRHKSRYPPEVLNFKADPLYATSFYVKKLDSVTHIMEFLLGGVVITNIGLLCQAAFVCPTSHRENSEDS
jgi:hypothetical protein